MKILKSSIITILLLVITLYLPTIVKATSNTNDIILNERKLYSNSIDNSNSLFSLNSQTVLNSTFKRSTTIPITRSSLNSSINMEITPAGHYVLVALFKKGSTTETIASSFTAPAGRMTAYQWLASELGDNKEIDVFISATADVNVTILGSITY